MSVTNPDHSRDSALLRSSDGDWAYKKPLNELAEFYKKYALKSSPMQDHAGVLQQCIDKLFVILGEVDRLVSPNVRVALLKALIVICNNFVSTHTDFCTTLQATLSRCRDSVFAAQETLTISDPALISQLPQLATLAHDLRVGGSVKVLPAPAPFLPPAGAVQAAVQVAVGGAPPQPPHAVTEGSSRSEIKPASLSLNKSAGPPSVKPARAPPVKPTGAPFVKSADAPLVKSASPAIKATGATAKHARTPTSGIQLGDDATKRPGLVGASQPLAETTRKAKRAASPTPATSHKRQKTAVRAGDTENKSDAGGPQTRAEIKASPDSLEEEVRCLKEENASLRRQIQASLT